MFGMSRRDKMQILVVDDEKVCLLAFVEELQRELPQAQIDSYRSGEEAWKAAQETHYDMVFTDITMNGMSGVELANRIHEKDPDIPIYFETGETPGEVKKRGLQTERCLFKPVLHGDVGELLDKKDTLPPFEISLPVKESETEESYQKKPPGFLDRWLMKKK